MNSAIGANRLKYQHIKLINQIMMIAHKTTQLDIFEIDIIKFRFWGLHSEKNLRGIWTTKNKTIKNTEKFNFPASAICPSDNLQNARVTPHTGHQYKSNELLSFVLPNDFYSDSLFLWDRLADCFCIWYLVIYKKARTKLFICFLRFYTFSVK